MCAYFSVCRWLAGIMLMCLGSAIHLLGGDTKLFGKDNILMFRYNPLPNNIIDIQPFFFKFSTTCTTRKSTFTMHLLIV